MCANAIVQCSNMSLGQLEGQTHVIYNTEKILLKHSSKFLLQASGS